MRGASTSSPWRGPPGSTGDVYHFVTLADGAVLVEEGAPGAPLEPLRAAVDASLPAPYRAEAVRRTGDDWAVAASRIRTVEEPLLEGRVAELVLSRDGRALHVDGRPAFVETPALERVGAACGAEYVVRASRLSGALWEVEATAL